MPFKRFRIKNAIVNAKKLDHLYVIQGPDGKQYFMNDNVFELLFEPEEGVYPHGTISYGHPKV